MAFLDDAGLVQLWQNIMARLSNKMDRVPGKVLSSNDFTDTYKTKLDSLENAAQPDWAAPEGEDGYILNKPTIPSLDNVAMIDDLANLASTSYVEDKIAELVDSSPDELNTLKELADALNNDSDFAATVVNEFSKKVDKVDGKGLSTNDYTTEDKNKLASLNNAEAITPEQIAIICGSVQN